MQGKSSHLHDYNIAIKSAQVIVNKGFYMRSGLELRASQHGIAAARLIPYGDGSCAPVASNRTEEGRARNRRVELVEIGPSNTASSLAGGRCPLRRSAP